MKFLHILAAVLFLSGFFITVSTVETAPHIACVGVAMVGVAGLVAKTLERAGYLR